MKMTKSKIIVMTIALVLGMAVLAAGNVQADAQSVKGYAIASEGNNDFYDDPNVQWLDGGNHVGNITVIDVDDPDQTNLGADFGMNDDGRGTEWNNEYDTFSWSAGADHPVGWDTKPGTGDNIVFMAQYDGIADGLNNNYVFAANLVADGEALPESNAQLMLRYEPIPEPVLNPEDGEPIGDNYLNISIENFKYTDFDNDAGTPQDRGTFHALQSYAVYIQGEEYTDWTYIGNSEQDPNQPVVDDPLPANGDNTDPTTIDTGAHYFNASGLNGGQYQFRVAPQFGPDGYDTPVWGPLYMDGEADGGAAASFAAGAASGTFDTPEFGPGILIPVVATIGLFTAIAIYRKKKEL
ncbi:MAG: hypothetical protein R6W73_01275 [Candidatus Saliniplasma sp.]